MKLLCLHLKNFKGCRDFTLQIDGSNASIYGDNGTFKTTLFDAFNWLLFGKDSQNKSDFQIKTLDRLGNEIHNLDHSVDAIIEIKGKRVELRKVYAEKYTKKRGSATADFTGHTTDYFINEVPRSKKEYDAFIAGIIDEAIFKLLTNPAYFNEQLHWTDRRRTLLEICGDISDDEVIASDQALSKLPAILNGRSLDDHRKVIAARRAKINDELGKIPVRIDEVQRGLPDVSGINEGELLAIIMDLKDKRSKKEAEFSRVQNGAEVSEKNHALSKIDTRILDIKNRHRAADDDKLYTKQADLRKVKLAIQDIEATISAAKNQADNNSIVLASNDTKLSVLRQEWMDENEREFKYLGSDDCPACGQPIPASQLEEAKEKALADFNLRKSQNIESINKKGRAIKEQSQELSKKNESYYLEMSRLENQGKELNKQLEALQTEINNMSVLTDVTSEPEYVKAMREKSALLEAIDRLNNENSSALLAINAEITKLGTEIAACESKLASIDQRTKGLQRIDELKDQEKALAEEFERFEAELYLTEQFIRAKVNILESRINSKFKYARFKLFETQVNGGVNECCETLYQGVPYSSGLNNAARINVGLDIISTLSEHYGFSAPIFVDNSEAVTRLIETSAQVIRLVVSEPDKALRVERESQVIKGAI